MSLTAWSSIATGTVDSSGDVTITIPGPSRGNAFSGTLSLVGVDNSGTWTCNVSGGLMAFNPTGGVSSIYLENQQNLVVTATATDLTSGTVVTGSLIGAIGRVGEVVPSGPLPFPTSSSVATKVTATGLVRQVASSTGEGTSTSPTVLTFAKDVPTTDSVVLEVQTDGAALPAGGVTGLGATWSKAVGTHSSTSGYGVEVWLGTSPSGSGDAVTITPSTSDLVLAAVAYDVGGTLAVESTDVNTTVGSSEKVTLTTIPAGGLVAIAVTDNGSNFGGNYTIVFTGINGVLGFVTADVVNGTLGFAADLPASSSTTITAATTLGSVAGLVAASFSAS